MEPVTAPPSAAVPLLYYAYPAAVFLVFLGSSLASACTLQRFKDDPDAQTQRSGRRLVLGVFGTFFLTYLAQLGTLISCSVADGRWPPADYLVVGILSCVLVFGIQLSWLLDPSRSIGFPFYGSWLLAFAFEALITVFSAVKVDSPLHARYEIAETSLAAARCVLLLLLGAACWRPFGASETPPVSDEERQSLLPKAGDTAATQAGSEAGYGATSDSEQSSGNAAEYNWERREREARQAMEKRLKEGGNWFEYSKGFMVSCPCSKNNPSEKHPRPPNPVDCEPWRQAFRPRCRTFSSCWLTSPVLRFAPRSPSLIESRFCSHMSGQWATMLCSSAPPPSCSAFSDPML